MFGFGTHELLLVAIAFLVLFGGAKLPGLMRNMGRSINEFKAGMKDKPAPDRLHDDPADDNKLEEAANR